MHCKGSVIFKKAVVKVLKNVIFIIKKEYPKENVEITEANIILKALNIAANKPAAIFQTNAGTTKLAISIKERLGSRTELINIVSTGNIQAIVFKTIEYMKKYLLNSQETLIIFIDNKDFISKFIERQFGKSLFYYPNKDPDNF